MPDSSALLGFSVEQLPDLLLRLLLCIPIIGCVMSREGGVHVLLRMLRLVVGYVRVVDAPAFWPLDARARRAGKKGRKLPTAPVRSLPAGGSSVGVMRP